MNAMIKVCRVSVFAALSLVGVGCHNYTVQPVCNDDNAAFPHGITGTYTFSLQDEEFNVVTEEIEVDVSENGVMRLMGSGSEEEGRVCQVGGHIIQEVYVESVQGYEQQRLYVTGMGLTLLPVFYDRARLEASGIPSKVIEVPETLRGILGDGISSVLEKALTRLVLAFSEEPVRGLMVDNTGVSPNQLMQHAAAGPVGATWLRR